MLRLARRCIVFASICNPESAACAEFVAVELTLELDRCSIVTSRTLREETTGGDMRWFLIGAATLHALFMACELLPWRFPVLLRVASRKMPPVDAHGPWTPAQQALVSTIVHNAGIYNAILAGGLFWVAAVGDPLTSASRAVAVVLLAGAALAGMFGTVTLRSPVTAVQAVVGITGLLLL